MGGNREGGTPDHHDGSVPEHGESANTPSSHTDDVAIAMVAKAVEAGPGQVVAVLGRFPGQREAMFRWLHTHRGNAYVQTVLAQGAPANVPRWTVVANPRTVQFPATEVGAVSPSRTIQLINHGDAPIDLASLELIPYGGTAQPAFPGEFEVVRGQACRLRPFQSLIVEVVFRPYREAPHIGAHLRAKGAGANEQLDVALKAIAVAPRVDHADQRELSVAEHDARRLEATATPSVERYGDLLAAVLAARALTDRAQPDDADAHARVKKLLEPVARRLDQLNDHQGRLAQFGAGNIAGQTALDTSQAAIASWLHRLALGAQINSDELVTKFRAGAEPIHVLTGERADAPTLRAFDHASRMTGVGAAAALLAPALMPMVAEEAALLVFAGRVAAQRVVLWALANPAAALAASETLLGFGLQIGEDGWETFWDQLHSPEGRWFLIAQVLMDYMHVKSSMSDHGGEPEGRPGLRPPGAIGIEPAPEPTRTPDLDGARQRVAKVRAVLQQVHDGAAATSETGARPAKPTDDAHAQRAQGAAHDEPPEPALHPRSTGQSIVAGAPWHTDAQPGLPASAATIRAETVEMELHPAYQARLDKARAKGFEIVTTTGDPRVEVLEVVDAQGKRIAIRRTLYVQPKMRFLDLEHEMGHIDQLDRFADPPPTKRMVSTPRGEIAATANRAQGILTTEQNAVTEYHNRLAQFVRLHRTTTPDVLAKEFQGIEEWRVRVENKIGLGRGDNAITRWAKQYFPELPDLEAQVRAAGFDLRPRTSRWGNT